MSARFYRTEAVFRLKGFKAASHWICSVAIPLFLRNDCT